MITINSFTDTSQEKIDQLQKEVHRGLLAKEFLNSVFFNQYLKPHWDGRHLKFDREYWDPKTRKDPVECAQVHIFQSGRIAELYEQELDIKHWIDQGLRAQKQLEIIQKRQNEING